MWRDFKLFVVSAKIPSVQEEREQPSCKASDSDELPPLTVNETMKLAFMFCFLRFIGSWLVNASLGLTSVASTTIFSSLSGKISIDLLEGHIFRVCIGFFTLIIGRIFRVERLTIGKIGAVVMRFVYWPLNVSEFYCDLATVSRGVYW